VNRLAQKARSFSASPELLASSFDPRLCDEKNPLAPAFDGDERGSGDIFLFDRNLFKLFHFFAAAAPMLPFIARITPGRFTPPGMPWGAPWLNRDRPHSDQLATI
jgi:hypothetical protein